MYIAQIRKLKISAKFAINQTITSPKQLLFAGQLALWYIVNIAKPKAINPKMKRVMKGLLSFIL